MPPTKRAVAQATAAPEVRELLAPGRIVNMDIGGRTLTGLEVLDFDDKFIKLRWDIHVAPQTEIVLIPWEKVGVIGLTDER
jgi:hypothetical protein